MGDHADNAAPLDALVDRIVRADREIHRHFWLDACAGVFPITDEDTRKDLFRRAARLDLRRLLPRATEECE